MGGGTRSAATTHHNAPRLRFARGNGFTISELVVEVVDKGGSVSVDS
jgi:hypothetical protein